LSFLALSVHAEVFEREPEQNIRPSPSQRPFGGHWLYLWHWPFHCCSTALFYAGRHPELRIDVALTPEGMAGTSQDLPAAEAAAAGVLPCSSAFVVRSDI
jgi:hypothetical protein